MTVTSLRQVPQKWEEQAQNRPILRTLHKRMRKQDAYQRKTYCK